MLRDEGGDCPRVGEKRPHGGADGRRPALPPGGIWERRAGKSESSGAPVILRALGWLGARAPWALAVGIALCFAVPQASHVLRPALPFLVPVVLGLAMARIDLGAAARAALAPAALMRLVGLSVLLMPVSAALYLGLARLAGLDADLAAALVYLAAAPPIASAANLCFFLRLNAARAIEVTVAATVLTPLLGPLTVALLLPEAAALSAPVLGLKLGAMIAGGTLIGLAIRRGAGPARMAAQARAFDGIGVIALVIFVIPLFDGVPALIVADPARAALVLAVAVAANLGVNLVLRAGLVRRLPAADAGAYGILFGNRTIALYLAALPADPRFAVFVALYQVPMLLTPLALKAIDRHLGRFDRSGGET